MSATTCEQCQSPLPVLRPSQHARKGPPRRFCDACRKQRQQAHARAWRQRQTLEEQRQDWRNSQLRRRRQLIRVAKQALGLPMSARKEQEA